MCGRDRVDVPAVESRHLRDLQPLRHRDYGSIGDTEREALVATHQFGDPAQVGGRDVELGEIADGDSLDQVDLGVWADPPTDEVNKPPSGRTVSRASRRYVRSAARRNGDGRDRSGSGRRRAAQCQREASSSPILARTICLARAPRSSAGPSKDRSTRNRLAPAPTSRSACSSTSAVCSGSSRSISPSHGGGPRADLDVVVGATPWSAAVTSRSAVSVSSPGEQIRPTAAVW